MSYGNLPIQSSGGKYLRIETGKPVDIHIVTKREDVKIKSVHYDGKAYVSCGEKQCVNCTDGLKKEQRFEVKVFDRSDNSYKIFEFGPNIAIGIREIAKVLELDGQTIHDVDLRISIISEKPVRYQVVQRKNAGPLPADDEVQPDFDDEVPL